MLEGAVSELERIFALDPRELSVDAVCGRFNEVTRLIRRLEGWRLRDLDLPTVSRRQVNQVIINSDGTRTIDTHHGSDAHCYGGPLKDNRAKEKAPPDP